ncbi:MAG: RNA polymerase sigma factor [Clostridia bacterium]
MLMLPAAIMVIEDDDDRAFMERVYLDHRTLMYRIAYNVMRDHFSADDIINTACERLCNKIHFLRTLNSCKLQAYVISTCKNTALNMLKCRNRQNARLFYDMDVVSETVASEGDISDHILREGEITDLSEALNELLVKERDILQMKYLMQKTDGEIASVYGIKEGSVRYYLTLARRHLAEIMKRREQP